MISILCACNSHTNGRAFMHTLTSIIIRFYCSRCYFVHIHIQKENGDVHWGRRERAMVYKKRITRYDSI